MFISDANVLLTFVTLNAGETAMMSLVASKPFWIGNKVNVLFAQVAYRSALFATTESAVVLPAPKNGRGSLTVPPGVVPAIFVSA